MFAWFVVGSVKIETMSNEMPQVHFRKLYDQFNAAITHLDCGEQCAQHNPSGKPFCCDICQAVPALYDAEWHYLHVNTDLWALWQGNECPECAERIVELKSATPAYMLLGACLGHRQCQRNYRALSCRQFPFFPYITDDYRFIGLAYEWTVEETCWVINNLDMVLPTYRQEFVAAFDHLFDMWPDEMESYAVLSAEMREVFLSRRWRIPILHRNGKDYLLSAGSERLQQVSAVGFRKFSVYQR
ncbi:MAG: hypothetical protein JEZ00_10825 [Anaerolineaceae bacterium]|nr:hypothetical protein [Anaerolineaceae bacterium]